MSSQTYLTWSAVFIGEMHFPASSVRLTGIQFRFQRLHLQDHGGFESLGWSGREADSQVSALGVVEAEMTIVIHLSQGWPVPPLSTFWGS